MKPTLALKPLVFALAALMAVAAQADINHTLTVSVTTIRTLVYHAFILTF